MRQPEELEELRAICSQAREMPEGGIGLVLLPNLTISGQGGVDALLCPQQRDGYPTRLFLSRVIPGKGNNWTTHRFLNRTWHSWSWTGVPAELRLAEILAAHLGALR